MNLAIELEQEEDGRWIAEIDELDGVLVYGIRKKKRLKMLKPLLATSSLTGAESPLALKMICKIFSHQINLNRKAIIRRGSSTMA